MGVVAILILLINFISTVNMIPVLTVFMPFEIGFILRFLRMVIFVIITIFAYALCFHYLLMEQPAFHNLGYSMVKTLVWMLGDLGYDDTFLNEETPVRFAILTNLLFITFVTAIGWLVYNISTAPTESFDNESEKNSPSFYRINKILKMLLFIDDCVPCMRRKYAQDECVESSIGIITKS